MLLRQALVKLPGHDNYQRAVIFLRMALLENSATRFNDSLRILTEAAPLFDVIGGHALQGKFHNTLGLVFKNLAEGERRRDYSDRAFIEYSAASFHFQIAGHVVYQGCVENNLGFLLLTVGKLAEAHQHLQRARRLLAAVRDNAHLAQTDETQARVFLAEKRHTEAERAARSAVRSLEKGDEQSLLAEALTTYGTVLARMRRNARAEAILKRAIVIAETSGDLEAAGRARLTIIEELESISPKEAVAIYSDAVDLLKQHQDPRVAARLIACARRLLDALTTSVNSPGNLSASPRAWDGFSFRKEILRYERTLIECALRDAGGVVSRAARLLGFNHHHSLISLINHRHRELLDARSAVRTRRRSLIATAVHRRERANQGSKKETVICLLQTTNDQAVTDFINKTMVADRIRLQLCSTVDEAFEKLVCNARYDLFLVDNDAADPTVFQLINKARRLSHRRRIPIIMLSSTDCETAAWRAGVDAFLRKPEDIKAMPSTIARLLRSDKMCL